MNTLAWTRFFDCCCCHNYESGQGDSGGKLSPLTSKTNLIADCYDLMIEKAQVTPAAAWVSAAPLIAQVFGPIGIPYNNMRRIL